MICSHGQTGSLYTIVTLRMGSHTSLAVDQEPAQRHSDTEARETNDALAWSYCSRRWARADGWRMVMMGRPRVSPHPASTASPLVVPPGIEHRRPPLHASHMDPCRVAGSVSVALVMSAALRHSAPLESWKGTWTWLGTGHLRLFCRLSSHHHFTRIAHRPRDSPQRFAPGWPTTPPDARGPPEHVLDGLDWQSLELVLA